jgi:lysophospholipase L1-like esterase
LHRLDPSLAIANNLVRLLLKYSLAPVLLAQVLATRRRALILPEAQGTREGRLGDGPPTLRLLIAGDSSAAGVGVDHQDRALAGYLTRTLHARTGRPLQWALRARSGLTTAGVHALLREDPPAQADVAVVVSGVNDLIEQVSSHKAVQHREALAQWLLDEYRAAHVVFASLPPVHRFPLLPQPLRYVAGADARRHDRALAEWAATRPGVSHVPIALELGPENMAADGFHPGEPVYRACGEALAEHIWRLVQLPVEAGTDDGPQSRGHCRNQRCHDRTSKRKQLSPGSLG